MNPPTALIAEDEPLLAASLRTELAALWPELAIVAIAPHGPAAIEQALVHRPDLVFLDVRMPGCTGLEAAQALTEDWPDGAALPLLVFVTAYDDHALQAFDLAAVDYVLKPVRADRLARTCARLREGLARRSDPGDDTLAQLRRLLAAPGGTPPAPRLTVIQAGSGPAIHLVPVDEVVYFEAADKYVRVLTAEREHLIRTSLRELLPRLDPERFWQVHRGTVVRADAVDAALRDEAGKLSLALRTRPERLPVSRLYAHRFKAM